MPNVELFMDEVVTGLRRRLALLGDSGDRRAIEDGIALLTRCRLRGMDEARFEMLLSTLRAGRAPDGQPVLKPAKLAVELTQRWDAFAGGTAYPARN